MCEVELKEKRISLYHLFDNVSSPSELFILQRLLMDEIICCERNISRNGEDKVIWQIHLDRLLTIGDSIVWLVLEPFTIRQLGKYESVRTSITNQENIVNEIFDKYKDESTKSIFLFADITRCVTIGDVIEVIAPDRVKIIECKSSKPDFFTAEKLLSGRIGRQFSKAFWLQSYLESGFGKLFGDDRPTKTFEIVSSTSSHIDLIPCLIDKCISNQDGFAYVNAEPGLVYIAVETDKEFNDEALNGIANFTKGAFSSTARLIEEPKETIFHSPPLVFNIPLEYRIMLQEVDINIFTILDKSYVQRVCETLGFQYAETEEGLPQLTKDGKSHAFHIRFMNDVFLNFVTVKSALETMVQLFSKVEEGHDSLTIEEQKKIESHPKNRQEFIDYLQEQYVIAKLSTDGRIVEVNDLRGKTIYKEN